MALEVQSLSELDAEKVTEELAQLTEMVQEANPTAQVKSGAFHDQVLMYSAILAEANAENIELVRRSTSLLAISEDPELANDDILDRIASNYRLTRTQGAVAAGSITVVTSVGASLVIPNGSEFLATNGLTYITTSQFTGRLSESQVINDSTDILMLLQSDGNWAMSFPAQAQDLGVSGNLTRLTELTPVGTITGFVTAFAGTDFSGGIDPESNTSLLARLQSGIAHKSLSSRPSVESIIRADEDFGAVTGVSVVGYGDAEQIRYHSIFPIAFGGRVDVYVRAQPLVGTLTLTKTCTFIEAVSGSSGIWQFSLGRDEAPGFYEVSRIALPDASALASGYEVQSDVRGFDVTAASAATATAGTSFLPDITQAKEAAYSRYQTAIIQFLDTDTETDELVPSSSSAEYEVTLTLMPGLLELQDLVAARAVRSPAGDCLVRAPVPCFTGISLTVNQKRGDPSLEIGRIQQAVANAVNAIGFTGRLPASTVVSAAQAELLAQGATNSSVGSLVMTGRIRRPDGTSRQLSDTMLLSVSEEPASNMVTSRTVAFFLAMSDVAINTVTVDIPEV